jgi:hypothetical protein
MYPKLCTISWTMWYAIPVSAAISLTVTSPFYVIISLISLLLLLVTGSLQETKKGLIGNVCVPAFRILYPSSDTASAHVHISTHKVKSCMNIWCGNFHFNKKPYHWKLPTQHVFVSHFLTLKHDHVTERHAMWFSFKCEMTDGTSHILCITKLASICL